MRVILALILIVGSEFAIQTANRYMAPTRSTSSVRPLKELTNTIGTWSGSDLEIDPNLYRNYNFADIVNRVYQNPIGDKLALNLTLWRDYDPVIPHKPEICYPYAGWDIQDRKVVTVTPASGPPFQAHILTLESHAKQILVLYWVVIDGQTAIDDDQVRKVFQRHRGFGESRPPAIKVMLQADAQDSAGAERMLVDLAAQAAPLVPEFLQ